MGDRLSVEDAGAQHSTPDKIFQVSRKCRRHPVVASGGLAVFHRTREPLCLLGGMGRIHSGGRKRSRNRRLSGIYLAFFSLSASTGGGARHPFLRLPCGEFLLACCSAGSGERKSSLLTALEYLDPSSGQYLCSVHGL